MEDRHYENSCGCGHHYCDNGGNNGNSSNNGIVYISNSVRSIVNSGANLPLTANNITEVPNNNDIVIDLMNNYIIFQPGIYYISYALTARIPIATPTLFPLTIIEDRGGRDGMRLSASAYNNENIATIAGSRIFRGFGLDVRDSFALRNETRTPNFQAIELLFLQISLYKLYDLR